MAIDRKFIIWPFTGLDQKSYEIEVRYTQQREDASAPFTFYVVHKNPTFRIEDSDLERLRRKVIEMLDFAHKLVWEPRLIVLLGPHGHDDHRFRHKMDRVFSSGFGFAVHVYERATYTDGRKFHRINTSPRKATKPAWRIYHGWPLDDLLVGDSGEDQVAVDLPDTEEVRVHLRRIAVSTLETLLDLCRLFKNPDLEAALPQAHPRVGVMHLDADLAQGSDKMLRDL